MEFTNIINNDGSVFLNILRVIAAQLVLIGHIFWWTGTNKSMISIASYGVFLFFILSGILISNSIFSKKNFTFKDYFISRFARIYSGLLPCLLIIAFLDALHLYFYPGLFNSYLDVAHNFSLTNFFGSIFMIQGIGVFPSALRFLNIGYGFGTARPLWSLGLEWWLYFMFGYLILNIICRKSNNSLVLRYVPMFLFSIIPVLYLFYPGDFGNLVLIWFAGVGITIILNLIGKKSNKSEFLIIGFLFILSSLVHYKLNFNQPYNFITDILMTIGICFILMTINFTKVLPQGVSSLSQFMADYSFTLYLIHLPIILLLIPFVFKMGFFWYFVIAFILSNCIAAITAEFTEKKHKALARYIRDKWP